MHKQTIHTGYGNLAFRNTYTMIKLAPWQDQLKLLTISYISIVDHPIYNYPLTKG